LFWINFRGTEDTSVSVSGVLDKVRIEHLPITSVERYCCIAA
jgi:hypothetical protein